MGGNSQRRTIDDIRCPLPRDTVILLHHTIVQITLMRRSIEATRLQVDQSIRAIWETRELLARLRGGEALLALNPHRRTPLELQSARAVRPSMQVAASGGDIVVTERALHLGQSCAAVDGV